MVTLIAAPMVPTSGYIRSTLAPDSHTGTGMPGTLEAVRSEVCAAADTSSGGRKRLSSAR